MDESGLPRKTVKQRLQKKIRDLEAQLAEAHSEIERLRGILTELRPRVRGAQAFCEQRGKKTWEWEFGQILEKIDAARGEE